MRPIWANRARGKCCVDDKEIDKSELVEELCFRDLDLLGRLLQKMRKVEYI